MSKKSHYHNWKFNKSIDPLISFFFHHQNAIVKIRNNIPLDLKWQTLISRESARHAIKFHQTTFEKVVRIAVPSGDPVPIKFIAVPLARYQFCLTQASVGHASPSSRSPRIDPIPSRGPAATNFPNTMQCIPELSLATISSWYYHLRRLIDFL